MSPGAAAPAAAPRRRQVLGFWSLLALGINGIVGVGIFFAPAELARLVPGPASALAFGLTALLLLPVAWSYGRLGSAYREDGGPYVWAREALGQRFAFGVGFVTYASAVLSTAAVVSGLGLYLAPVLGAESPLARASFRVGAALLFSALALCGLRPSAWIWSALTLLKLLPLLLLALLGGLAFAVPVQAASPAPAFTPGDLARAALLAVFPLQGFEIVAVPAGEVHGGPRTVLLATLFALGFSALLYVLLQLACVRAVPDLAEATRPVVAAGSHYTGSAGTAWFAAGTNISAIGIAFGMFVMTPRYLAALGTEAQLGTALSRERRGVPVLALGVTTACVVVLVSSSSLGRLFVLSSLAVLTQYAVTAVCLLRLARRRTRGLGLVDEWLAPLTLVSIAALAHAAKAVEVAILAGLLLIGFGLQALRRALASRKAAR